MKKRDSRIDFVKVLKLKEESHKNLQPLNCSNNFPFVESIRNITNSKTLNSKTFRVLHYQSYHMSLYYT